MIIIQRIHDELNAEEWWFNVNSSHSNKITAVLEYYHIQYKDNNKQRKWRIKKRYDRGDQRAYRSDYTSETVPEIPADVIAEVKQKIMESLEVVK